MKALYLRTQYWFNLKAGGSVTHTAGIINSLSKYINLDVISNEVLPEVKIPINIIKPIKIPFFPNSINEILYNFKVIKLLKNKNYNFIYQRYHGYSFCGAYLSKKWKIPFILEFNSSDIWKLKHWKNRKNTFKKTFGFVYDYLFQIPTISKIENYNLKSADLIVVISKPLKDYLISVGVPGNKILVNPNGVDVNKYNPNINASDIKEKYNLKNKVVLGFIGTFGPWHGAENIVKAYGELLKLYPEYKNTTQLLMIGNGPRMSEVKEYIKKYKIKDKVILTGLIPQEEAPKYLSVCDILINATVPNPDGSEFFGSPTKIFEYMAMGKAIISSNIGQLSEILEDKKTAILVKPADIKELMNAMKILIENEKLRKKFGINARKIVEEKYTWDKHVERILEKLKNL